MLFALHYTNLASTSEIIETRNKRLEELYIAKKYTARENEVLNIENLPLNKLPIGPSHNEIADEAQRREIEAYLQANGLRYAVECSTAKTGCASHNLSTYTTAFQRSMTRKSPPPNLALASVQWLVIRAIKQKPCILSMALARKARRRCRSTGKRRLSIQSCSSQSLCKKHQRVPTIARLHRRERRTHLFRINKVCNGLMLDVLIVSRH